MGKQSLDAFTAIIVGRGRVGTLLAHSLRTHGVQFEIAAGRKMPNARPLRKTAHLCFFLAVPDAALPRVADKLQPLTRKGDVVLHCSGLGGIAALAPLAASGVDLGVLHPLHAIYKTSTHTKNVPPFFAVDGSVRAKRVARAFGEVMGWQTLNNLVPSPLYHAAAVTVAAGTYALIGHATEMLVRAGASRKQAEHALAALAASAINNVREFGTPRALTGPMVRGDQITLKRHRAALRDAPIAQRKAHLMAVALANLLLPKSKRKRAKN